MRAAANGSGLDPPYLKRGVTPYFRCYDLPFLNWLARTGRKVDVLAQSDLERASSAAALAASYDLIVFPGHHEYVTTSEYDLARATETWAATSCFSPPTTSSGVSSGGARRW